MFYSQAMHPTPHPKPLKQKTIKAEEKYGCAQKTI
jgi:hypothetical protein